MATLDAATPDAAPPGNDGLDLDSFLCFAVYSAGSAFGRAYKPLLDRLGLTYPQYLAMVALWQKDGQMVSEIGARLFLESNTLTPLLKRLEAAGLVRRVRSVEDERQVRIFLTEAGNALRQEARAVPPAVLEACGRSAAQMKALRDEVAALRDALNAHTAAAGR